MKRSCSGLGQVFVGLLMISLAALCSTPSSAAGPGLQLTHQASRSVANDEMVVMMAIERDGPQVGPLNEAVVSQLNAAIAEARKVEGVRARLGGVSTQPNYTREGKLNGWRVRGDVVLESSRMPALAQLAGKLGERLQMSSVQFRLSRERRRSEEQSLLREAAQGFRDKALQTAQAFGYKGYEIKELVLQPGQGAMPRPMMMARSAPDMAAAAPPPPLPDEGGDSEVTVAVSGTVELTP